MDRGSSLVLLLFRLLCHLAGLVASVLSARFGFASSSPFSSSFRCSSSWSRSLQQFQPKSRGRRHSKRRRRRRQQHQHQPRASIPWRSKFTPRSSEHEEVGRNTVFLWVSEAPRNICCFSFSSSSFFSCSYFLLAQSLGGPLALQWSWNETVNSLLFHRFSEFSSLTLTLPAVGGRNRGRSAVQ